MMQQIFEENNSQKLKNKNPNVFLYPSVSGNRIVEIGQLNSITIKFMSSFKCKKQNYITYSPYTSSHTDLLLTPFPFLTSHM